MITAKLFHFSYILVTTVFLQDWAQGSANVSPQSCTSDLDDGPYTSPAGQASAPNMTKPSDRAALLSLWEAMSKPDVMIDWGNEDPCVGKATTPNAAGFAFWKGVACQPCNDDPTVYCVRSIFLHQKSLIGSIPTTFSNLSDLEIILLSANNITGPIQMGILSSFPKLRRLDVSYNMIDGTLPLSDLSGLHDLKSAFFDNNHLDAIDNPSPPFTGGFEALKSLNFNYNRNMTCGFPSAIAYMPKLEYVNIHDTNITGPIPTDERAFYSTDMLMLSGSSICGNLPPICNNIIPGRLTTTFCDVNTLPTCDDIHIPPLQPQVAPPIRLGTGRRNYGNATLQVYKQVMEDSGFYTFETITDMKHKDMYQLFTEMPRTENTIDIVVASDLPNNHGQFLEGKHDVFFVIGTSYEAQSITIVMPSASKIKSLHELSDASSSFLDKTVYTFDYLACPVCFDFASKWAEDYLPGFIVEAKSVEELSDLTAKKIQTGNDELVVVSWIPHGFNTEFSLKVLDMQELKLKYMNQGKVLVRKDAAWKLGKQGMSLLASIIVPTGDVQVMDLNVTKNGMTPAETAARWISEHQDIVDMWSW